MMNTRSNVLYVMLIIIGMCFFTGCVVTGDVIEQPEANPNVVVPAWAPPYDDVQHVRYYYLPDIGVYYDVWDQDFAYLQDGNWMFASSLPPIYPGFDLYNSYVVVLDSHVYEPWMHHHYYVAHYPSNYYHSVYNVDDTHELRGFNENSAREVRLKAEERNRLEERSKARPDQERVIPPPPAREQQKPEVKRPPERMKYYGQDVGKPVKVEKQMMKPRDNKQRKK